MKTSGLKISLSKFIEAAASKPAIAQTMLDTLDWDITGSDYPCIIANLVDDVTDDPNHYPFTPDELQEFLEYIDITE